MMDPTFCNKKFPVPWKSSIAISAYEPKKDELPEPFCAGKLTYLKVTVSITGYQPTDEEIKKGYVEFGNTPVEVGLDEIFETYFGCYGVLANIGIFPNSTKKWETKDYPKIIGMEPKIRELIQRATESGEILTSSNGSASTGKSFTRTFSNMFNNRDNRLRHIIVLTYFLLFQLEFINSQTIINGSFELNTANSNQDYTNITNSQFNNLVTSCYSFGNQPSPAGLDLITTDNWDGKAKDGKWYVGIERKNDEYEELLSLELTGNLIENNSYKLTFYDNARESLAYTSGKLEIGLSEYNNSFGDLIFTTPENASYNKWTLRYFTFNAPNNGKYLTVRVKANEGQTWLKIDDFCLSKDDYCVELPEIEIPNVFTPNNDGVNDLFKPVVFKGMEFGNMIILNRWGNVVYESNDLSKGWDGTFQNKPVSDGVYFYKIHYKTIFEDEEVKYGSFHLFR